MKEPATVRAGGVALIAGAMGFLGVFAFLATRFDHPAIPGMAFAYLAAVAMRLGLPRWPGIHWALAEAYLLPPWMIVFGAGPLRLGRTGPSGHPPG